MKRLLCPVCQSAVERRKDFMEFDENQKSVTFHCVNKDCQCTFVVRKKKKQRVLFNKKYYERGW